VSKYIRWITLLVLLLLLAAPALAQGRVIVDDPTGSINETTVEQAASNLVSKGATVVVLVSENTGSDPQAYARQRLSANGIQANPLDPSAIVYLVALDLRNVFIYYGADWNATLGPTYETIADRDMIPQMARGNVTEGIVAGINGTVAAIDNPPGSTSSDFLAWLIGLPIVGGLILFLWRGFSKRRAAAQVLASARESAEQSRRQAGAAIADMGQALVVAREKAQYDKISYATADVEQLTKWQSTAEQQFVAAQEHFDSAEEALAAKRQPAVADYQANTALYGQVVAEVAAAREPLERAEARRRELDQLNAQAPGTIDQAKKALADAAERVGALRDEGARPDAITREAEALVARAESLLAEHRAADAINTAEAASAAIDKLDGALTRYNDIREGISAGRAGAEKAATQEYRIEAGMAAFARAEDLLRQALRALEQEAGAAAQPLDQAEAARAEGVARGGGMPALRRENEQRLPQVEQAGQQLATYIAEGRRTFDIVDEFAESTWSDIRGNGSEAESAAAQAHSLWQRATERNTMEAQDFLGAKQDLDAAEQQIAHARTLIDTILQRLKDLEAAREAARSEISMAQADIEQGWKFVRSNDPDVGKVPEEQLQRAAALLEQANAELAQQRPDWLALVKQAREANQLADQALVGARSEVETIDKLRAEVANAQQLAGAEVQKIVKFAGLHAGDLPPQSQQQLDQLQGDVRAAYEALKASEQAEDQARLAALRAAQARYTALHDTADKLYDEIYAAFQRVEELRKQVDQEAQRAQAAIARAEQLRQTYSAYIPHKSEGIALLGQARAALGRVGAVHDDAGAKRAIKAANEARSEAEQAERIFRQAISARQGRSGDGLGDFVGGVLVGSILNSGGDNDRGSGGGGWGSGGGSLGGWGGGGGGGWGGGGGGGGGWGGGGGGGSGW
jgi:hypothetical protein